MRTTARPPAADPFAAVLGSGRGGGVPRSNLPAHPLDFSAYRPPAGTDAGGWVQLVQNEARVHPDATPDADAASSLALWLLEDASDQWLAEMVASDPELQRRADQFLKDPRCVMDRAYGAHRSVLYALSCAVAEAALRDYAARRAPRPAR